jgi:hypothetical protein
MAVFFSAGPDGKRLTGGSSGEGEATSSLGYRRHKTSACLGRLTDYIWAVAKQLRWRCTFSEFES